MLAVHLLAGLCHDTPMNLELGSLMAWGTIEPSKGKFSGRLHVVVERTPYTTTSNRRHQHRMQGMDGNKSFSAGSKRTNNSRKLKHKNRTALEMLS